VVSHKAWSMMMMIMMMMMMIIIIIIIIKRLQNHMNGDVSRLLNVQNIPRRLKRKKPFELAKQQTTK
jgi:hypothetical protein